MESAFVLGFAIVVLFAGPVVIYALVSFAGGWLSLRGDDREATVPRSATGNSPSRAIPGGNPRDGD